MMARRVRGAGLLCVRRACCPGDRAVNRRTFLSALASAGAASALGGRPRTTKERIPVTFKLSGHGCGRATAYSKSNKIVTIGDKTHAA